MLGRLVIFLLLLPASLTAQNIITGKVVSLADKKPVPDASVFLSNASAGDNTAANGTFTLHNVKNGQYDLVVSCVGYEPSHQKILVNNADIKQPVVELTTKITALKEVKIAVDVNREQHQKSVLTEFFGRGENARDIKLLNPEALFVNYDKETAAITAYSDDFLMIENNALGYKIKYLLKDFEINPRAGTVMYTGSSVFEPMKGSKSDEKRWQKKRIAAYLGSQMHFLRSCIQNQVAEEGFRVQKLARVPHPARPPDSLITEKLKFFNSNKGRTDSLLAWRAKSRLPRYMERLDTTLLKSKDYIKLTQKKGVYAFGYPDCLLISYKLQEHGTVITFKSEFSFFDDNGVILNPQSCLVEGPWGFQRIADLLPVDYELPTTF